MKIRKCEDILTSLATISSTSHRLLIMLPHIPFMQTPSQLKLRSMYSTRVTPVRGPVADLWELVDYRLKWAASGRTERKRVHISGADVHRKCA
jgi:hypothetical protein